MNSQAPIKLVFWIIWAALLGSIGIYVFVLQTGASTSSSSDPASVASMRSILLTIALIQLAISFSIRFFVTQRFFPPKEKNGAISPIALGSYIFSLAFAEAAAIYGLILGFMGADVSDYEIFFIIGIAGLLFQPPTFLNRVAVSSPQ